MEQTPAVFGETMIEWLTGRFAFYLERPADEISPDASLVELGLDSMYALSIAGEIEEEFDIDVPATILWDCPTVEALAAYLDRTTEQRNA